MRADITRAEISPSRRMDAAGSPVLYPDANFFRGVRNAAAIMLPIYALIAWLVLR